MEIILDYLTREAGAPVAARTLARLWRSIDLLADHPRAAPLRGRRLLISGAYVVLYQIERESGEELVLILHVIHGARDIPKVLEG